MSIVMMIVICTVCLIVLIFCWIATSAFPRIRKEAYEDYYLKRENERAEREYNRSRIDATWHSGIPIVDTTELAPRMHPCNCGVPGSGGTNYCRQCGCSLRVTPPYKDSTNE